MDLKRLEIVLPEAWLPALHECFASHQAEFWALPVVLHHEDTGDHHQADPGGGGSVCVVCSVGSDALAALREDLARLLRDSGGRCLVSTAERLV